MLTVCLSVCLSASLFIYFQMLSVCLLVCHALNCIHYRKEAHLQIEALKEQLSGANGLVARLEAAEDESQLKIKQLQSKRDSFKRQAGDLQRQLDTMTEASDHSTHSELISKA